MSTAPDARDLILRKTKEIAEAAAIIQALLVRPTSKAVPKSHALVDDTPHELTEALTSPGERFQFNAVDRMLYILGVAHSQKRDLFSNVLAIQGRERRYFAKSEKEIEESGTSTQPRKIKGSEYWVMTNSTTRRKRQMVRDVLRLLGYSQTAIKAAARYLGAT